MPKDDKTIGEKIVNRWFEENALGDISKGALPTWVTPSSIPNYLGWQAAGPEKRKADAEAKYQHVVKHAEIKWGKGDSRNGYEMALYLQGLKKVGGEIAFPEMQTVEGQRQFRKIVREKCPGRFPDNPPVGRPRNK